MCSTYREKFEAGEFPECFRPCPPFYDICNVADFKTEKCDACFEKFGFVDYIE